MTIRFVLVPCVVLVHGYGLLLLSCLVLCFLVFWYRFLVFVNDVCWETVFVTLCCFKYQVFLVCWGQHKNKSEISRIRSGEQVYKKYDQNKTETNPN